MTNTHCSCLFAVLLAGTAMPALAQSAPATDGGLTDIVVTAQRRSENLQNVPLSVATVSGDALTAIQSSGADIRALSARVPSLNIESSFGRTFPRFYIRGLGNTDFDLNASQPVSLVYDDVVLENPILKGFPIFDLDRVEVLRGPQGTLFGRNTPAGIVKFDTVKPDTKGGYARASYGTFNTLNLEGAAGGEIGNGFSVRLSGLYQRRSNWLDNLANGAGNDLEGYEDLAARLQLQYKNDGLTVRLVGQLRKEDGTARVFRANAFAKGSNKLIGLGGANTPFNIRQIRTDGLNFQHLRNYNLGGTIEYDAGPVTVTSVTSWWSGNLASRGDIDGGAGTAVPFSANSQDDVPALDQFTQELRLASNGDNALGYQAGLFYFDERIRIGSFNFNAPTDLTPNVTVTQRQKSTAFGVFGSLTYKLSEEVSLSGGLRYNKDKRDYSNARTNTVFAGTTGFVAVGTGARKIDEDNVTWDGSIRYTPSEDVSVYARIARGYRAPSIQGRALFPDATQTVQDTISTARSETINSYEVGLKSKLADNRVRFNLAGFYYRLNNAQLTAVGGASNAARLVNAAAVDGYGFEAELEARPTQGLDLTAGLSYNHTEIKDPSLFVAGCTSGCTVLNTPRAGSTGIFSINGNSLPQAPEWSANWTARYGVPVGSGEVYAFTDWAYRSKIEFFLYRSAEYNSNSLLEGGLRIGYKTDRFDVAGFVRNITDNIQPVSGIDFNNLTAMVNEPRTFGFEVGVKF